MKRIDLPMLKYLLVAFGFLWVSGMSPVFGQSQEEEDTLSIVAPVVEEDFTEWDEVPYVEREFDEQALQELRDNADYFYDRKPGESLLEYLERFLKWLFDREIEPSDTRIRPTSGAPVMAPLLQAFLWLLIIVLAAFLLFQLFKVDFRKLIRKKSDDGNVHYEVKEDALDKLPFEDLINEAVEKGLFRTAVRFHYLRSLKGLQDANLILWKFEKTNAEYLNELGTGKLRDPFAKLTLLYEYIWYGEFPIEKPEYTDARDSFGAFDQQVKGGADEK